jgi:hypothetical protein
MKKAVCVLSAGIKKNEKGEWTSTDLTKEDDVLGAPGGKLRVAAASYLYKNNPESIIIASGGRGWDVRDDESNRPNLAEILKRELIDLGVSESSVIKENKSNKTFEQLKELKKIIVREDFAELTIITNDYHLPRVKAMLEYDDDLHELLDNGRILLRSAEEICLRYDRKKWQNIIKEDYESEEMKKRIEREENGVKQIKNGIYKF